MEKVSAPFTDEQVININNYQNEGFHPFTCCSHEGCERTKKYGDGALFATCEGLVCPCGKYKQDWVHEFMTEPQKSAQEQMNDWLKEKLNNEPNPERSATTGDDQSSELRPTNNPKTNI